MIDQQPSALIPYRLRPDWDTSGVWVGPRV